MLKINQFSVYLGKQVLGDFGLNTAPAKAESLLNFDSEYDFSGSLKTLTERNLAIDTSEGFSESAKFGLTKFLVVIYAPLSDVEKSLQTGQQFRYSTNPEELGFSGKKTGIELFGNGDDKLFGIISGVAAIDPQTLLENSSGEIIITGGKGRFQSASGRGTISSLLHINPNSSVNKGKLSFNFSFTIPK